MHLRIIAGQYRSRRLRTTPGMKTRPTSDRLRQALFNVITAGLPEALRPRAGNTGPSQEPLADTVWLDVFAGVGAVGLEALSRGARMVYFIDSARAAAATIRENLRLLKIEDGFEILEREAAQALRLLDSQTVVCDFCFLDPPYRNQEAYEETLGFLSQSQLLRPTSTVIAEHDKHFDPGDRCGALQRFRTLRQGDASLSFYRLG